jgi:interferon gamma-inducible protein 30
VTTDLKTVWNTPGFSDILNLEMLPYGNARGTTKVTCQHGPEECAFNMIEACGIEHLKDPSLYMPFIFCVEESDFSDASSKPTEVLEKCAPHSFLAAITTCYGNGKGAEGSSLIAAIAEKTKPLNHGYTPWVVVDGKHSEAAENNLEKAICKAYKGSNKPAACAKHDEDNDMVWMDRGSLLSSTAISQRCERSGVEDIVV